MSLVAGHRRDATGAGMPLRDPLEGLISGTQIGPRFGHRVTNYLIVAVVCVLIRMLASVSCAIQHATPKSFVFMATPRWAAFQVPPALHRAAGSVVPRHRVPADKAKHQPRSALGRRGSSFADRRGCRFDFHLMTQVPPRSSITSTTAICTVQSENAEVTDHAQPDRPFEQVHRCDYCLRAKKQN